MHEHGFQGLRTDKVIKELGITKGAFYHYFSNKQEVGYCVVDEIISPQYLGHWRQLNRYAGHPVDGIIERLESLQQGIPGESIRLGCPLNNLIQEMAPLDEGFQKRLKNITGGMYQAIKDALLRGQGQRLVQAEVDADQTAYLVLSSLEGAFGIAKSFQSRVPFDGAMEALKKYLQGLKV